MSSLSRQTSPAPTYQSTCDWPLEEKSATDTRPHDHFDAATKPDHLDLNHPHYIPPPPPPSPHPTSRKPQRSWWTRKHILIPYALAALFFLTTLWFTCIALGVRFLNVFHEKDRPVQDIINVYVDGVGRVETTMATMSSAASSTAATSTGVFGTTSTYTGRLHLAQTGAPDIGKIRRRETGFVTIVRTT